jgi:hypothetical protein
MSEVAEVLEIQKATKMPLLVEMAAASEISRGWLRVASLDECYWTWKI